MKAVEQAQEEQIVSKEQKECTDEQFELKFKLLEEVFKNSETEI